MGALREYAETLEKGGAPRPHKLYHRDASNQWIADVFPSGLECLLYGGMRGELWLEPGKEPHQGLCYRTPEAFPSGVGAVLGAGNQTPVAALDIRHILIAGNQVVCCKMNPVNEYMGPFLRRAFAPFVESGFLEIVYGGAKEGAALCNHELVASVHLTGSVATYDAVVWQGKPKKKGIAPPFAKPVGAELGCVTPYIIVPGKWSNSDLQYHAETVATGLVLNSGHNCLKAEVLVTDKAWPQRDAFLEALKKQLEATSLRTAYYPGSEGKIAAFKAKFPDAEEIGSVQAGQEESVGPRGPWVFKTGLSPEEADTENENWCGVLQEVALTSSDGADPAAFLQAAVNFANNKCWGTLSCVVIAHPATQKSLKGKFEEAIATLRYGNICINVPGSVGFGTTKLSWGGFPGTTPDDIGSGNCAVHNTMLFENVQKSVMYGAWRFHPHPFWLASHQNTEGAAKEALKFVAQPSMNGMLPLAIQSLRG